MVYKHAISTVVPARNVRVGPGGGYVQAADGSAEDVGDGRGTVSDVPCFSHGAV